MTDTSQPRSRTERRARRRALADGRRLDAPDGGVYVVRAVPRGSLVDPLGAARSYGHTDGMVNTVGMINTVISTTLGRVFARGRWTIGVVRQTTSGGSVVHSEPAEDEKVHARLHELADRLARYGEAGMPWT